MTGNLQVNLNDIASPVLSGAFSADSMHLQATEEIEAVLNAEIDLRTQGENYLISGTIEPDVINVALPDRFNQSIPELNIVETDTPQTSLLDRFLLDMIFFFTGYVLIYS